MPYIGMFTEQALQQQIDAAGARLTGNSGLVLHADTGGDVHLSLIEKVGDHISVEGTIALDASNGFHFDKEHLVGKVEIVAEW